MRVLAFAVAGGLMAAAVSAETHKGYETPPYSVEAAEGAMELRRYGAHLVAEVTVAGSREAAINTGFRMLAGYIFGGNAKGESIAMTVPVAQSAVAEGTWTVRFMMPGGSDAATLPQPGDDRIRFVTVGPERQTALRFSGLRGTETLQARADELRAWTTAQGLTITTGPHFYFYDGPMTLPWMRRNEVAFTVQ